MTAIGHLMPDTNLSDALKEAYASAPADVIILDTLEIRHPTFDQPIRVVRNYADQETWLTLGGASVQAVLDGLTVEEQDRVGLVARLEVGAPEDGGVMVPFYAMAFNLELPPVDTMPVPEISVSIDNVGQEISDALDLAVESQDDVQITYRPYLSNDIEGPDMDPPLTMTLFEADATPLHASGRARMLDIGNKAFPAVYYTALKYPGLAR